LIGSGGLVNRSDRDRSRIGRFALVELRMPLSAGTRLGPYEVLSVLGAGGMGEVKVLPELFATIVIVQNWTEELKRLVPATR